MVLISKLWNRIEIFDVALEKALKLEHLEVHKSITFFFNVYTVFPTIICFMFVHQHWQMIDLLNSTSASRAEKLVLSDIWVS